MFPLMLEVSGIGTGKMTEVLDKIEKVIELTVQKLLELSATRGLITSALSPIGADVTVKSNKNPVKRLSGFPYLVPRTPSRSRSDTIILLLLILIIS